MLFAKYGLMVFGIGLMLTAGPAVANDLWLIHQYQRKRASGSVAVEPPPIRWRTSFALTCLAWAPILIAFSLAIGSGS